MSMFMVKCIVKFNVHDCPKEYKRISDSDPLRISGNSVTNKSLYLSVVPLRS